MDKPFFTRTQPYGDLRIVIEHWYDTDHEAPIVDPSLYADRTITADNRLAYLAQDQTRLDRWEANEWHYMGITAEVWTQPRDGWTEGYCIGRSGGLWGIESDSDPAYLVEIGREEMRSAIDSANETRRLLTNMVNALGDLCGDRPVQSDT